MGSCGGAPPDILRSPSDNEIAERFYARTGGGRRRRRKKRFEDHMDMNMIKHIVVFSPPKKLKLRQNSYRRGSDYFPGGSHSPSSGAGGDGSLYDSDSLRSRASCDSRLRISDLHFGMPTGDFKTSRFAGDDPQGWCNGSKFN